VQVPIAYISSLVLNFFYILYVWGFYYFLFFFKINSGVFLHNRVATLHIEHISLRLHSFLVDFPYALLRFAQVAYEQQCEV